MSETAEPTDQTRSSSTAVVYRHVTLASGATLNVHEDRSVFVAIDDPPPIRSVVQLWRGDEARAVVVQRVVEVPAEGETRGFVGVFADDEVIAAATKVGTEHLESASGTSPSGSDDGSAAAGGSDVDHEANIAMAMPAPVVGDVEDEPDNAGESDGEGSEDGDDESEGGGEPEGEGDSETSSSGRRRRGRGRGRRRK